MWIYDFALQSLLDSNMLNKSQPPLSQSHPSQGTWWCMASGSDGLPQGSGSPEPQPWATLVQEHKKCRGGRHQKDRPQVKESLVNEQSSLARAWIEDFLFGYIEASTVQYAFKGVFEDGLHNQRMRDLAKPGKSGAHDSNINRALKNNIKIMCHAWRRPP